MRVPIPLVLFLSFTVIGGGWWYATRKTDFLTPPSNAKLSASRSLAEAALPQADHPDDALSVPAVVNEPITPPPVAPPQPVIELGDLTRPPSLREYAESAAKGASYLIDLADLLETKGEPQRALLAWERVLDMGKPNAQQATKAIASIQRLRATQPPWNKDRAKTIAITLSASTNKKNAKTLTPILAATARELESASAGILKVTTSVTPTRNTVTTPGPAPVALWFKGSNKDAVASEVILFTSESAKSMPQNLTKTVFLLVCGYLGHDNAIAPPAPLADDSNPAAALTSHVTRLHWQNLGATLNRPPKKHQ